MISYNGLQGYDEYGLPVMRFHVVAHHGDRVRVMKEGRNYKLIGIVIRVTYKGCVYGEGELSIEDVTVKYKVRFPDNRTCNFNSYQIEKVEQFRKRKNDAC